MKKLSFPLLLRVVVALAAMGLLPLAVTYFQLRSNRDALAEQVLRTHVVASLSAAKQVDTYLEGLTTLAQSVAVHPVLLRSPRSPAAQELVRGVLQAQPSVVLAGLFNAEGENVFVVRRSGLEEGSGLYSQEDARELAVVQGAEKRWLRVQMPLAQDLGRLMLLADAESLDEKVQNIEIGREALLALANRDGELLSGGAKSLEDFPANVVEQARSGKLGSGSSEVDDARLGNVIVGYAELAAAPWFVLSRQPAAVANVAQEKIRRVTRFAALGATLLACLLATGAWLTVVRPLRRLAAAQRELIGEQAESSGGSEIDQLQASFELLQQRVRDSEDLGKVFLGRYQVTGLVGSGAMGSVFQGWDPKLKRELALKTIRVNAEDIDQQKLITSLLEEAAVSARFNHPNIVTVYDVADEGNAAFIAMEYVDGVNLEKYLSHIGPLEPHQVVPLGLAIANALATAHQHDLVHHDVKPANVLLGDDGSIKVTDFGISELISAATKSDDVICGTPGYIAPECFLGEVYGPSADLFALGLILYEAIAGKNPFHGRTLRETILNTATVDPEPLEMFRSDLPRELIELIESLMEKEPADRPANAASVVEMLEQIARKYGYEWALEPVVGEAPSHAQTPPVAPTRLITVSEQQLPD